MSKLERVSELPVGFFDRVDYLWILKDGKVYKRKKQHSRVIHQTIWGSMAWGIDERGYYNSTLGVLSCHTSVDNSLERKLARKFPDAIRLRTL